VFINDLRVISETCDNAAVFLHYLVWRARLPLGAQIRVSDEIDLWGSYLLCEQFEALAGTDTFTMMSIGNASTDFDAYYAGVLGEGPEARRPAKFLREPAKSFVERMAAERPAGWRDAAGACLDMSIPEQAFVAAMAKEAAQLAAREGLATWREVGRVALVGLPRGLDVVAVAAQFTPDSDEVTLVVYCRATRTNRTEIIWAGYARPLTLPSRSVGEKPAA
jgi:hypothetical protein